MKILNSSTAIQINRSIPIRVLLLAFLLGTASASARDLQYTYAWPYAAEDEMKPRGGTTKGTPIDLKATPSEAWRDIQQPSLSKQEKDRRAIIAMAGRYRASFDFIETSGFITPYQSKRPYQSWGTEIIYVVEDKADFVSLQHILVMTVVMQDGSISDPIVVKHWRQDWTYEDRSLHTYQGNNSWSQQSFSKKEAKGSWSQAVFQVDDSPRYESIGQWEHVANYSSWSSSTTWRPLPRREFSVRSDYDVLVGTNRHTITPLGWTHEEDNLKVKLDDNGNIESVLAREAGFNRYERIENYDFSAGEQYWRRTMPFWKDVSEAWKKIYKQNKHFSVKQSNSDTTLGTDVTLIGKMFDYADQITEEYNQRDGQRFIQSTLEQFLVRGEN